MNDSARGSQLVSGFRLTSDAHIRTSLIVLDF